MACPMRDTPLISNTPTTANFEYDDNEWDIGIGDLIIDLDADIEKTGVGEGMATPKPGKMHSPVEHQATVDKGLKMKIKRTKPGTKHEIVKSGENGEKHPKRGGSGSHRREKKHGEKTSGVVVSNSSNSSGGSSSSSTSSTPATTSGQIPKSDVNGVLRAYSTVGHSSSNTSVNLKRTADEQVQSSNTGMKKMKTPGPEPINAPVKTHEPIASAEELISTAECAPEGVMPKTVSGMPPSPSNSPPPSLVTQVFAPPTPPPPLPPPPPPGPHFHQHNKMDAPYSSETKEVVDVCVGTSVGTITEPDCLGPCEPGTSVTLEGIVWHETEGVLVVNVTWRGKTYVGTLLDCSKHDWAPPRFCESPISDLDARAPKGRGKRGRGTTNSLGDLSNFTETRSSMHSKLRSNLSGAKGRKGPCSSSPTPFSVPKSDASSSTKRKTKVPEEDIASKRKVPPSQAVAPINTPVLLECPEPNCSKKYKHINGLKYHQSHAHISPEDEEAKESGVSDEEYPAVVTKIETKKEEPVSCVRPPSVCDESGTPENEEKLALAFISDESSLQTIPFPNPSFPVASSSPTLVDESSNSATETQLSSSSVKKILQFKVKPASELMPEEKKIAPSPPLIAVVNPLSSTSKPPNHKKKSRKSPVRSPNQSQDPPALGLEVGRDVQSPAYSDISDDAAPLLESEVEGKPKRIVNDKKESNQTTQLQSYGMYPYYGQPPYLVPSVQDKSKESPSEKIEPKQLDKEKKEGNSEFQQKFLPHNYYQFGYPVSSLPYNFESYPAVVVDGKKEDKTPALLESKPVPSSPAQLHIPTINKPKIDVNVPKEKPQNENHQILKESIEIKNQMSPTFLYPSRQQSQSQDDMRRYYLYPDRKEGTSTKSTPPPHKSGSSIHSPKLKDKPDESKKDRLPEEKKQEGVKPTMETQGPPPPPTSQYAYIHPGYMQSAHYGALPFDPSHPMYRGMNPMLVSGFPPNSYIHPHHIPVSGRYHAPEDLSRPQTGKALDLLQHHASQYYSHPTHKIHELQERAIKSPTPKASSARSSPSTVGPPTSVANTATSQTSNKITISSDNKDARSPPPQRHVHTHHHTHVGLGYPILAGQYPAPYGAAVLASEHAAAVSTVPYQPK